MARIAQVTSAYAATVALLKLRPGTSEARAVGATVRELLRAEDLPLPGDVEAFLPPKQAKLVESLTGRRLLNAYVRRVSRSKSRRLWVWYRARAGKLELVLVTDFAPRPVG